MTPSTLKQSKQVLNDEYMTQGMIIHEMRLASRRYGIPIVTITQNNRSSENMAIELGNDQIGDSIKKIRYSDNIIMIRQRQDLDIFSETVAADICVDSDININNSKEEYLKHIVPFEAKVTKAKDGEKGRRRFHIFNKKNLKIYDTINEMIEDHKKCVVNSTDLTNQLALVGLSSSIDNEMVFDEDNPFENLIL